jgi:hypothetical protein
MIGFVNVLEEILFKEIYAQIEGLRPEIQTKVKVDEVLAYAVNRLPPLFATSMVGWQHQRDRALNTLQPQISQLVRQGIKTVLFGDPLHDLTPLPNHLFTNSASVLYRLSQILGRKHLRWRDVPVLIEEIVTRCANAIKINSQTLIQYDDETVIKDVSHLSTHKRALLSYSKRFMEKRTAQKKQELLNLNNINLSEAQGQPYDNSWAGEKKVKDAIEMEYRALQSYTLQAQLGLVNVLEHLVFKAMERITTPELYAKINKAEVAAYALNHLPPMYATSDRGFRHMRQRAITELARELIGAVRTGVMKVMQDSHIDVPPIYAYQFEREHEQSIQVLKDFLKRDDISLDNLVPIVKDLLVCQAA